MGNAVVSLVCVDFRGPGLPDLPTMTEVSSPDPGWLTGSRGFLVLGVLAVAFGTVGYFCPASSGEHSWERRRLPQSEIRAAPNDTYDGRFPLLRIPDPNRRVGIADVRLLQRFRAGVDFRRCSVRFTPVDSRLPEGTR